MGTFTIRNATPQDTGLIYGFILKMARYEKLESEVDTSEEALRRALFDERQAEVVIGEENGIPVGFALFFHNFSSFVLLHRNSSVTEPRLSVLLRWNGFRPYQRCNTSAHKCLECLYRMCLRKSRSVCTEFLCCPYHPLHFPHKRYG